MSLGLLAKDSIADLSSLVARSSFSEIVDESHKNFSNESKNVLITANPQQAQEDDRSVIFSRGKDSYPHYLGQKDFPRKGFANSELSVKLAPSTNFSYRSSHDTPLPQSQVLESNYCRHYSDTATPIIDDHYIHDSYSSVYLGETKKESRGILNCIFPCLYGRPMIPTDTRDTQDSGIVGEESIATTCEISPSIEKVSPLIVSRNDFLNKKEEDEISTNSDVLGERLSERERQALLARLRLAQPDTAVLDEEDEFKEIDGHSSSPVLGKSNVKQKGLLHGISSCDSTPLNDCTIVSSSRPIKGILKRRLSIHGKDSTSSSLKQPCRQQPKCLQRRSLFPSYASSVKLQRLHSHNVHFASMARVVPVKSKNEMTKEEKSDVWFQKNDYEDFRKSGRIITKAMLEGGSEIWLTTSLHPIVSSGAAHNTPISSSRSIYHENCNNKAKQVSSKTGEKWWHKFGHSRRGLEHIVSFDEGRQRQANVRNAIQAVIEEQARQKRYKKIEVDKLRSVSLNHTNWARDLALASGASDADAVRSSFATDRKSREFFLSEMVRSDAGPSNTISRVPEFMQPALFGSSSRLMNAGKQAQLLDANTAAQIRFRRDTANLSPVPTTPFVPSPQGKESAEPIRDPKPREKNSDSMAYRAKGFTSEGAGKVDVSAILSGLGAVSPTKDVAVTALD